MGRIDRIRGRKGEEVPLPLSLDREVSERDSSSPSPLPPSPLFWHDVNGSLRLGRAAAGCSSSSSSLAHTNHLSSCRGEWGEIGKGRRVS